MITFEPVKTSLFQSSQEFYRFMGKNNFLNRLLNQMEDAYLISTRMKRIIVQEWLDSIFNYYEKKNIKKIKLNELFTFRPSSGMRYLVL